MRLAILALTAMLLPTWPSPAVALGSDSLRGEAPDETAPGETPKTVEALALYSEDTRNAMLEVCLYPELVMALGELQVETSNSFRGLLSELSREEQQRLWELVRFPELVDALVAGGRKSESEIRELSGQQSDEVRAAALEYGRDRYELLRQIRDLRARAEVAVDGLLASYTLETQAQFRKLLERPEVLSLLVENPELTRRVGDQYRRDPEGTRQLLAEIGGEAAERNQLAVNDWVRELEEDPEAEAELRRAAEEFASQQGLDTSEAMPSEEVEARIEVVHHYYHAYPFWFSYPYWYPYAYWYPRPYYYHWGFYYRSPGAIVVTGPPSNAFAHWYFGHRDHHRRYPHLAARFERHAERHRHWRGDGSAAVRTGVRHERKTEQAGDRRAGKRGERRQRADSAESREPGKGKKRRSQEFGRGSEGGRQRGHRVRGNRQGSAYGSAGSQRSQRSQRRRVHQH